MASSAVIKMLIGVVCLVSVCHGYVLVEGKNNEGLTCWTCHNKTDNEACNDWAPDRQCRAEHTWCRTVHLFKTSHNVLSSVQVNKQCVLEEECHVGIVGCTELDEETQICISCCNENYCNEAVPQNHLHAIELSKDVWTAASSSQQLTISSLLITGLLITYLL